MRKRQQDRGGNGLAHNLGVSEPARIVALLRPLEFAADFSDEELAVLSGYATVVSYGDGETVVDFNETDYDLIVIASGSVEIRTAMNDVLDRLNEGCVIGELSFIDRKPRSARVVAAGRCEAVTFRHSLLTELSDSHPLIVSKVLRYIALVLCKKLRSTTRFMEASFV